MSLAREQRNDPRINAVAPVRYESPQLSLQEITRDISLGGVFLSTDLIDEVGTGVSLEIMLPGTGMIINARGRVRWNSLQGKAPGSPDRAGMGVQFVDLEPWAREILLETFGAGLHPAPRTGTV